ncbi:MAG: Holliday junction branch migration DNA helicase RuvB [Candidatus Komeilibacteria bacterium]|jgi:holliday junction DNA helicase RuvB|nr:Holliday junction branch migration DNA helicase RuvB [Candidatus Komeilibacteria bacterium]MBT4447519.1 Holliday junction branch migration DNA helicase RuvB [Candidatus Komeilibacteria bacterium]
MGEDRLTSAKEQNTDHTWDLTLRPQKLKDYVGQEQVKENLDIVLQAAQSRKEPIDHTLLYGPPGLGKTTLAHIIAKEMGVGVKVTSGPAISKAGDLAAIITNLQEGDILFIDEIHRLNKTIEEILYPAMEDFALDLILGKGPSAQMVRLDLPKFTLIGATTRYNLISSPLRDRFGVTFRLNFYNNEELAQIVKRAADILAIKIDDKATLEIASRSRATPRIANRILKRVRDYSQVKGDGNISYELTKQALNMMAIDKFGLDDLDRKLLAVLVENFGGGPVGLSTLAASVQEEAGTIEEIFEPYLMQLGLLSRTSQGRIATDKTYEYLGIDREGDKNKLF